MFSRENPSTCQTHAGLIRGPPAINQREQCILGVGGNSCQKNGRGPQALSGRMGQDCQATRQITPSELHIKEHVRLMTM